MATGPAKRGFLLADCCNRGELSIVKDRNPESALSVIGRVQWYLRERSRGMTVQRYNIVMTNPANSVHPEWLFIMRHAKAARPYEQTVVPRWRLRAPVAVLKPSGEAEAREIGGAFAEVLEDLQRADQPVQVTRFLHEDTKAATATAQAFRSAYERAAAAIKGEHGSGPPPLAPLEPIGREISGQRLDVTLWLAQTTKQVTSDAPAPATGTGAALIIGHDPGMSWLLADLLHTRGRRFRRGRDIPALARAELMGMNRHRGRWQPVWALSPSATEDINEIRAKIKSKMDTAKVFGGFITAVLTFVISQYATVTAGTAYWAAVRAASLAALAIAVLLYLLTMFWYDRLLMPTRFWVTRRRHPAERVAKVLLRPPSSAVWVLYQNMQRTWRLLFVPATYAAAIGIAGFAAARVEPSTATALIALFVGMIVIAIAVWWGWWSRPILGVQD